MIDSLAKAKDGVGNTWQGIREQKEFQTMIIILLCCHLGEGDREFWVSATEEEDENHLQHGQLLA